MSKKRVFHSKDYTTNTKKAFFVCGEKVCFADCEVCLQIKRLNK